jgi:hypothetical protein
MAEEKKRLRLRVKKYNNKNCNLIGKLEVRKQKQNNITKLITFLN